MATDNTIYTVSRGSYSDYHIVSAWSTEEAAEAEAKRINVFGSRYNEAYVESHPFNPPKPMTIGIYRASVSLDTGETLREPHLIEHNNLEPLPKGVVPAHWLLGQTVPSWGYGKGPEQALKSARDARAEYLLTIQLEKLYYS